MKIIRALTLRHLKLNRQRTLVTILGVMLSVALITTVPTFVASFYDMLKQETIQDNGNWHVRYEGVAEDDVASLTEINQALNSGISQDIGYAELPGSKNPMKPYLFVTALNDDALEIFQVKLLAGRLPETPQEVILSEGISTSGGVSYEIGDELTLQLGQRVYDTEGRKILDGERLPEELTPGQEESLYYGEYGELMEKLIPQETKTYRVTGFIQKPAFESYSAPGFTLITVPDPADAGLVDLHLTLKNVTKASIAEAEDAGSQVGVSRTVFNEWLLKYYGIMGEDNLNAIYGLAAVVIGLIMISSIALIFNSFAISIAQRSRQMGLLASVGATRAQKAGSVLFEGWVIAAIGIPLGILLGLMGLGLTFRLIAPILEDLIGSDVRLKLVISPLVILISVLVSSVTVFLSALLPAIRASRISAIDAIRQTRDVKLTERSVRTSRLTRRIFGFEAELGLKNLKRNKNRYRITVLSLVVSVALFLTVSAITYYAEEQLNLLSSTSRYNLNVHVTSNSNFQARKAFYEHIKGFDGVTESISGDTLSAGFYLPLEKIQPEIRDSFYQEQPGGEIPISVGIQSIDDEAFDSYAKASGVDPESMRDPASPRGILISTFSVIEEGKTKKRDRFDLKAGETIHLMDYSTMGNAQEEAEVPGIDLALSVIQDLPTPFQDHQFSPPDYVDIIVSETVYQVLAEQLANEYFAEQSEIKIVTPDPYLLAEEIREYQKISGIGSLSVVNEEERDREARQFNMLTSIFFYGFVGLFVAISVANIFNTISTGVSLRKAEFAALKSVGMTPKGFRRMIRFESVFYGIKALAYGLPISFGLIYLVYRIASSAVEREFTLPWKSIMITVLAVFVLVGLTMSWSAARLKRENIIEALKSENV